MAETEEQLEFSIQSVVGQRKDQEQWIENQLLYSAKMQEEDGRPVLVKFTLEYRPRLHHFCDERAHAPKLLGYGTVPGE